MVVLRLLTKHKYDLHRDLVIDWLSNQGCKRKTKNLVTPWPSVNHFLPFFPHRYSRNFVESITFTPFQGLVAPEVWILSSGSVNTGQKYHAHQIGALRWFLSGAELGEKIYVIYWIVANTCIYHVISVFMSWKIINVVKKGYLIGKWWFSAYFAFWNCHISVLWSHFFYT